MQSDSIKELATALAKAQATIQPASKNATNPHFRSKYADLGAIWDACRKPLADNGLSVVQMPTDSGDGRVALTTMLLHTSGEYISSTCSTRLQKDDAQGVGSALTYLRRYALAAMVGIVADEDDDGNAASQPQRAPRTEYVVPAPKSPPKLMNDPISELKRLVTTAKEAGLKLPVSVAGKVPGQMTAEQIRIAIQDLQMAIEKVLPAEEDHSKLLDELDKAGL